VITVNTNSKPVSASRVVMTQLVLPEHTNSLDTIFGGVVMSWIDIAGAISAQRHSQKDVVTASLDDLHFIAPVRKGWVVNINASVNFVSRTSMEVGIRVDAENPKTSEHFHVASAYMTFVALGSTGKPTPVPGLIMETAEDRRRHEQALRRRELRLKRKSKS
jgi:acyl-CoA hydrolase